VLGERELVIGLRRPPDYCADQAPAKSARRIVSAKSERQSQRLEARALLGRKDHVAEAGSSTRAPCTPDHSA